MTTPIIDLKTLLNHTDITSVVSVNMNESANNTVLPRLVFRQTGIEYDENQRNNVTIFEDFSGVYSFEISVKANTLKQAQDIINVVGNTMMIQPSDLVYEFESQDSTFDEEDDTNEIQLFINTRKQ